MLTFTIKVESPQNMYFLVPVAVKKYLLVFLKKEIGEEYKLRQDDPLKNIIASYLCVKKKKDLPKITSDMEYYNVRIPMAFFRRHKVSTISDEGVRVFADYFESYFTRLMIEWVNARISLKDKKDILEILEKKEKKSRIQINESIRDFLNKYEITDDLMSFDTALKRFQRRSEHLKHL